MALRDGLETDESPESILDRTVINLLLVDLGSPANIGSIMRSCHTLGGMDIGLFIFDPRDNLSRWEDDIYKTSVGLSRKPGVFMKVPDLADFLSRYPARRIKTDITADAISLPNFRFRKRDLILLGNENRGYFSKDLSPHPGTENIENNIVIPMLGAPYDIPDSGSIRLENAGVLPNLSVSATANILIYTALNQLGKFRGFKIE